MNPTNVIHPRKELQVQLRMVRKFLLICGILSSLLYVGTDILAALRLEGYSYTSQAVSELFAIGASTRPLVVSLFTIYNLLVFAFGLGILITESPKRSLHATGILLIAYGILGQVTLLFFPIHTRGAETTLTDTIHAILTGVLVLLMFIFMVFGAASQGKWFRLYSIVTIIILILFGVLTFMEAPRLEAQLPTPWFGIKERMNIYTSHLWVMVLAISLLRARKGSYPITGSDTK